MPEPLTLLCDDQPERGDCLVASAVDTPDGLMYLTVHEDDARAGIILDQTTARELFNWLGVWLHTFKE